MSTLNEETAKEYDMTVRDYYEYIITSHVNGQGQQMFDLFSKLKDKSSFIDYLGFVYGEESFKILLSLLKYQVGELK